MSKKHKINSKIFSSKNIRSAYSNAMARASIEGIRFHDLRRTYATYLKNANIDIHTISYLLGHSNITTTERYLGKDYQKLLDTTKVLSFIR